MKTLSIAEASVAYGTAVADLQYPLILQQARQPLAVLVSFEEYQHWQALALDETQRRQAGWHTLESLLEDVHYRPATTRRNRLKPKSRLPESRQKRRGMSIVAVIDTKMNGFYPVDVGATWADVSKAERWLGRRVQVAYDVGIGRLVAWYQANRAWGQPGGSVTRRQVAAGYSS